MDKLVDERNPSYEQMLSERYPLDVKKEGVSGALLAKRLDRNRDARIVQKFNTLAAQAVKDPDGCMVWPGPISHQGYGVVQVGRRLFWAHRVSYEIEVAPIPLGLTIDHLCYNRACFNPDHLEAVTSAVNSKRAAERRRAAHG